VLNLSSNRLKQPTFQLATTWLIADCMEAKAKQELWTRQKPETLAVLREQAIIQSTESSNRIEGVTISANRLRPLVIAKSRPRDRSEEELAGYRRALDWIFSRKGKVTLNAEVIKRLHAMAQGGTKLAGSGDAGQWKTRGNEIVEIQPTGHSRVRFVPATAKETPGLIDKLCRSYQQELDNQTLPPILLVATFVFDFLCIHPFRDGNGRVSRLLTTLLLQTQGFEVSRYISLERLVEDAENDYYQVLEQSSRKWREDKNDVVPWWNFFLGIVRSGYRELENKVSLAAPRSAKTDLTQQVILEQVGEFTLGDLVAQLPSASPQLIKKVLAGLKQERKVQLEGRGRSARWRVVESR